MYRREVIIGQDQRGIYLLALNIEILILKSKNSVKMRLRMLVFYAVTSVFCALCLSTETFLFASVLNALSACMAEDY